MLDSVNTKDFRGQFDYELLAERDFLHNELKWKRG